MKSNYLTKIIEKLNSLLDSANIPLITEKEIVFVMDKDVIYAEDWTVNHSKTFSSEDLDNVIEPIIVNGPSWVHANLLFTAEQTKIIALNFGSLRGNPSPEINVSFEKKKVIILIV